MKKIPLQDNNSNSNKKRKTQEFIEDMAKTWIPLDDRKKEKIVQGGKSKIPTYLIISIITVTCSLMMIVSSSVLVGSARNEQNDLEDKIAELEWEISELRTDLNKKNAEANVETFAKEELGMIGQEYVNFEYINSNKTDELEKQQNERVSFGSLMKWIFQQLK